MATIDPKPHFGLVSFADDDERYVARIVVQSEEIAAILDGLSLVEPQVTVHLLRLVMAEVGRQMLYDLTEEGDGWTDGMKCADDMQVLAARLPLAARIHKFLMMQRKATDMDIAQWEGWDADIRERFVGKLPGFSISGAERDALVREVRAALKATPSEEDRMELSAILADTGREKSTGRPCTISSLSMPTLIEWLRRLGPDISSREFYALSSKRRKKLKRRHELIRDMWIRVRREVEVGPKAVAR